MARHLLGCISLVLVLPPAAECRLAVLSNRTLQVDNEGHQILLNTVDIGVLMQETTSRLQVLNATVSRQAAFMDTLATVAGLFEPDLISDDGIAQIARLTASDAEDGDRLGVSVAIANNVIAIGGQFADAAYLSRVSSAGDGGRTITATKKVVPTGTAANYKEFGTAIALSTDASTMVVGAPASKKVKLLLLLLVLVPGTVSVHLPVLLLLLLLLPPLPYVMERVGVCVSSGHRPDRGGATEPHTCHHGVWLPRGNDGHAAGGGLL